MGVGLPRLRTSRRWARGTDMLLTRPLVVRLSEAAADPRRLLKTVLLAMLPGIMLVVSPDRPIPSFMLAPAWLAAAIILSWPGRGNRAPIMYAGMAGAFIVSVAVTSHLNNSLSPEQKSYGLFKAVYFMTAVLPLGVGTAILVDRAEDFKPTAVTFIVLGGLLSVAAVLFRDTTVLGNARYTWQGVLSALAGLLLLQGWIWQRVAMVVVVVVACIVGVALTLSRQGLLAAMVALVFTAAYWFAARRRASGAASRALRWRWLVPFCLSATFAIGLTSLVAVSVLNAAGIGPAAWFPDVSSCHCALARYRELFFLNSAALYGGDQSRIRLLETGWHVFITHPLSGAGLGSLDGLVRGVQNGVWVTYQYPHDLWLELAAETGLPGLLIIVAPLAVGMVWLWRAGVQGQNAAIGSLLVIVCAFVVVVSFSGDLPAARTLWIFALPCLKLGAAHSYPKAPKAGDSRT
jgi:hypothetical protein